MPTQSETIDELRKIITELRIKTAVLEEQHQVMLDRVSLIPELLETVTLVQERQTAAEKQSEKWSGRVWQMILAVWVTAMGLISAGTLAWSGFKK